jgi:hypothetical protein
MVASIRSAIDQCFSDEDIHNGVYFDVFEGIKVPSEDGEYADYDAVVVVTKKQRDFIQSVIDEGTVKIAYVCL